ncbi:MAG: methyltransferase [Allosphingosinicella sp.]|uniref:methyltransferase n=1 Tax=Allosphingosinicella sp. TaxID=2823234 RepID=UPI003923184A
MAGLPHTPANPVEALIGLASGLWVSRALWAAARLGIADAVDPEPTPLAAIAERSGAHLGNLRRLMNALVSIGLFRAEGEDRYGHGDLSPFLRSDHPISQRAFIESVFGGEHYAGWGAIEDSLRSGGTAFDSVFGQPVFDWYGAHPAEARKFSRAMEGTTRVIEAALLATWTPPPFTVAVDVGGSRGTLVASLLQRNPESRGILFDLPDIVDSVEDSISDPRIDLVGGSFFDRVPEGDLYLLKMILHDWTDEQSEAILNNIHAAIRPGGHIAIIETVLPEEVRPSTGYLMDLNMMVMTGGRERTASEFGSLLDRTGFRLESVTPTPIPMSVVQAVAV